MKHRCKAELGERGQSLTEFAMLLPVLLIIIAGVLDLGRLYYAYVMVTDAAAEGLAYAINNPPDDPDNPSDPDTAQVRARAMAATDGLIEQADAVSAITVDCPDCPDTVSGDPITVTVSYDFPVMMPFVSMIVPDGVIPLCTDANGTVLTGAMIAEG